MNLVPSTTKCKKNPCHANNRGNGEYIMCLLNNLTIQEVENYLHTIFYMQNQVKDKGTAALEFELQVDALASKIVEMESLHHA